MKSIASCLFGLIYLALVSTSSIVVAAEFTCGPERYDCLYDSVAAANQTSGPDTIRFSAGVHEATMSSTSGCAPAIVGDITIIGSDRATTLLHSQGNCAFFHVNAGSSLTL